jgi:3,5-dihydroxyphenylacetyl-CoA synthase
VTHPRIAGIGTANPSLKLTQQESFVAAGYKTERIRNIFLNSDIDYRHFYLEGEPNRSETSNQLNDRYSRGSVAIGCKAIAACLEASDLTVGEIDFLAVCTCTGYVCPDVGSLLITHMHFRDDVQRAAIVGLGCAGALPTLQRVTDFVRAHPGRKALMLAVEICSACYFVDTTLETAVGNAVCADGAAAFLLAESQETSGPFPKVVDFESFLDTAQIGKVGLDHRDGKFRIVLGAEAQHLAGPMIEQALARLFRRHGISMADIRFWVLHPGGRKVIDNVQERFGLTDAQLHFYRTVLRNYGNMSSPTVMFVLDEVMRNGDPQPGDQGVMVALGPGMAAEVVLLRW